MYPRIIPKLQAHETVVEKYFQMHFFKFFLNLKNITKIKNNLKKKKKKKKKDFLN